MSDNPNPNPNRVPIEFWPATAGLVWSGVQLATAIIDIWKRRLNRRRSLTTGFEKIISGGEKIQGWETAISYDCIFKNQGDSHSGFGIVRPFWPENESGDSETPSSLLMHFEQDLPDGRKIFCIRRYSTICPDVSSTIMQIVYKKYDWKHNISTFVTDRVIAFVFQSTSWTDWRSFRVLLIDTITKSHRCFSILPPVEWPITTVYAICPCDFRKRRINILFMAPYVDFDEEPPVLRKDFIDAPYEIPSSDVLVSSSVWQSISIPVTVNKEICTDLGLTPPVCVTYDVVPAINLDQYRAVTYDRRGNWRYDNFSDWLSAQRSTGYGSKLFNAAHSLDSLSIPNFYPNCDIPPLRYLPNLSGYHIGGALYFDTPYGVLRRFVYPSALKRLAAETFCRSKPRFKFSNLKKSIGFDIFDGIVEEEEKKDWQVLQF